MCVVVKIWRDLVLATNFWRTKSSPEQHFIAEIEAKEHWAGALASWNSAHANQNCADTAPRGGGGRFYCFAR